MSNINCPTDYEYELWFSGKKEKAVKTYINDKFRWFMNYDKRGNNVLKIKPNRKEAVESFEYWQTVPSVYNKKIKPILLKVKYKKIAKLLGLINEGEE